MVKAFDQIHEQLNPLRKSLLEHSLYAHIDCLEALHFFMQHHVFAVWDFMSLLKTLQQRLCHNRVPWLPPESRQGCRMVNEIVLAEESDEDGEGGFASHFELYHQAMQTCGADTSVIDRFLDELRAGRSVQQALVDADAPIAVRSFVSQTFQAIEGGDLCAIASAFTFGREDLLPELFRQIVNQLSLDPSAGLDRFKFYLERHIDLDGDEHGPMAEQLVNYLCGDSEANRMIAERAAIDALESRLQLWNSVGETLASLSQSS